MPHPHQVLITFQLAKLSLKGSLANKTGLFFSFAFPLIFISIFGFLGQSGGSTKIGVSDTLPADQPLVQALDKASQGDDAPIELTKASDDQLSSDLKQSDLAGYLTAADQGQGSIKLVTAPGTQDAASTQSLIEGFVSRINLAAYQQAAPALAPPVQLQQGQLAGKQFGYIDYILPGQLGFSLLSLSTFGVAFLLISLRQKLVLKRIVATATRPATLLIAIGLGRVVQAVLQAAVIVGVGILAFNYQLTDGFATFVELIILSMFGVAAFVGFGILVANVAKDEESAPVALNLFNLPQFLLSGAFFPIDILPNWLQPIASNLPLTYLNDAMRKVTLDGQALWQVWPYLLGMFAWAAVAYILAARTFKAE